MKYSLGLNLAEFGFAFFEKLHEPIFLLTKKGNILKMNEAARKFMSIAKVGSSVLEDFIQAAIKEVLSSPNCQFKRFSIGTSGHQALFRNLQESDFILLEVLH